MWAQCDNHCDCVCMCTSKHRTRTRRTPHRRRCCSPAYCVAVLHQTRCSVFQQTSAQHRALQRSVPRCDAAHHCCHTEHRTAARCTRCRTAQHCIAAQPGFSASHASVTSCTRIAHASDPARGYSIHLHPWGPGVGALGSGNRVTSKTRLHWSVSHE